MQQLRVFFVADGALPEGHDFVLIGTGDEVAVVYRESAVCPRVMQDVWDALPHGGVDVAPVVRLRALA